MNNNFLDHIQKRIALIKDIQALLKHEMRVTIINLLTCIFTIITIWTTDSAEILAGGTIGFWLIMGLSYLHKKKLKANRIALEEELRTLEEEHLL